MEGYKISIVTICMNAEALIQDTITSVINNGMPVEYIIIDGLSTDRTNDIVEMNRKAAEDAGITLIHISEKDNGISDAFNKGISKASGDIIGLINAGDQLLPGALKKVMDTANAHTADVIYGDCIWSDVISQMRYIRKSSPDSSKLQHKMVLMHPACFVRKSAYEKYGVFEQQWKYAMDYELMLRFQTKGAEFRYISEPLSLFLGGGTSDMPVHYREIYDETTRIQIRYGKCKEAAIISGWMAIARVTITNIVKKTFIWKLLKKGHLNYSFICKENQCN